MPTSWNSVPSVGKKKRSRRLAELRGRSLAASCRLRAIEALVIFCEGLGDFATVQNRSLPTINFCFTPLRAAFDPYYQRSFLEEKKAGMLSRALHWSANQAFRVADRRVWRGYDHVIAISEEVRRDRERRLWDRQIELLFRAWIQIA